MSVTKYELLAATYLVSALVFSDLASKADEHKNNRQNANEGSCGRAVCVWDADAVGRFIRF